MTYSIQAFIAVQGGFPAALPDGAIVLPLDSGMQMIPLGSAMRRRYAIPFLPLTDDGATVLPATLQAFCARLGAMDRLPTSRPSCSAEAVRKRTSCWRRPVPMP